MKRHKTGQRGNEVLTDPIPTKFFSNDLDWVDLICMRSGLGRAEVIRRSVRVLAAAVKGNPGWNWVAETSKPLPALTEAERAEMNPQPAGIKLPGLDATVKIPNAGTVEFDRANAKAKAAAEAARRKSPRRIRS